MSSTTNLVDQIKRNYLLHGLSEEEIGQVAEIAVVKDFSGGDQLVRQFAKDSDLMIILEGFARIATFSGETIAEAGPGSVIGEMSLVDDKPRSATVISKGPSKVAMIPSEDLWRLMDTRPAIGKTILANISRILCARLRAANMQLDLVVSNKG